MLNNLYQIGFKKVLTFLFIFSVVVFAFNIITSSRAASDDLIQIGTAVNFIEGNGFSVASSDDFIQIVNTENYAWPYFYRVISIPFLLLTNKNVELTSLLLTVLAYAFSLFSLLFLIYQINIKEKEKIILFICFFSPIITSPLKYGVGADLFTLGVCILAIVALINYWYKKQSILNIMTFSLLVALLPFMRYAYVAQAIAFVGFFFILNFFVQKKSKNKWFHYSFLLLPIASIVSVIQSPYFSKTSSKIVNNQKAYETIEYFKLWLRPFYAPFFNSYFPDHILLSFVKKFPFYESIAQPILILFSICSFFLFLVLVKRYLWKVSSIKDLFSKEKIIETSLVFVIITNLIFYIYIYRKTIYSIEDIYSGLILYKNLAVVSRYFIPIYISTLILTIIYAFSTKYAKIFKTLLLTSVVFGFLHYSYLRILVYSPTNRIQNMDIVNNPPGSYNDIIEIGDYLHNEKKKNKVFYLSNQNENEENYRQIKPLIFAIANAAILVPEKILQNDFELKKNEILLQAIINSEPIENKNWDLIYNGKIYSLYKYKQ